MESKVFVNRTLNLRKIKYVGFDMDHTLIRYNNREFEGLAYKIILDKLIHKWNYPNFINQLKFNFDFAIRGLIIDCINGNILKVNRHCVIRASTHGTKPIEFSQQKRRYKGTYIDLGDSNYIAIDTNFSLSFASLYAQLVDLKDGPEGGRSLPDYNTIAHDVLDALDEAHRDGTLKSQVKDDLGKYVLSDPLIVKGLERFKKHDKKLFLLTNSDYMYSSIILDFAINPFLSQHSCWQELFDYVIVNSTKPRFFYDNLKFLKVNPENGTMTNFDHPLCPGIYHGGCANRFTSDLNLDGDDILYVGDHIYGDIVRLKKDCNWRTALVVEELGPEIEKNKIGQHLVEKINSLMIEKTPLEKEIVRLISEKIETKKEIDEVALKNFQEKILLLDNQISDCIKQHQSMYKKIWGRFMRAGNEESYFAYQMERYACIYMTSLIDLLQSSPRTYYRSFSRLLPHEAIIMNT